MNITVKRPKSKHYDESKFKIFVNGQHITTLQENQSFDAEVNHNPVTIEAKLNWTASKKKVLEVFEGDVIEFIPNSLFSKLVMALPALMVILFVLARSFETLWLKWIFGSLLALVVATILYILIIARRKWIFIDHIKH